MSRMVVVRVVASLIVKIRMAGPCTNQVTAGLQVLWDTGMKMLALVGIEPLCG